MKAKMKTYLHHPGSLVVLLLTILSAVITVAALGSLIVYILVKGVPHLTPQLFAWTYNSDNVSMLPALINTLLLTVLAILIAGPLGIFAAIYMVEYAKKGNKIVGLVRVTAETLSGIPSIVYGLFGMLFYGGDHGAANDHENQRGGIVGGAEKLPRRKLWTGSGKASNCVSDSASIGSTGNFVRRDPFDRSYRW